MNTLVLLPKISFSTVSQYFDQAGWRREPDPDAHLPILPGEPDGAIWRLSGSDVRAIYTFHPAMHLRLLTFDGTAALQQREDAAQQLPHLSVDDLRELLTAPDAESKLLGMYAASALEAVTLIEPIHALTNSADTLIAQTAQQTVGKLLTSAARTGIHLLKEFPPTTPINTSVFPFIGDVQSRRQILRWLMRNHSRLNEHIEAVLRAALVDPDWELRVTAMLGAARWRARGASPLIERLVLPDSSRDGVDSTDQRVLKALRQAALDLLDGAQPPPPSDVPLVTREAMQAHIMRCAAGLPVPHHERVFLLVHALTQPFDPSSIRPASLPSGLTFAEENDSYWLDDLEMLWIPPIPHWLGDELHRAPIENPIRSVTPSTGFFIAQNLASEDAPRLLSWSDAQQWCAEVARHYGVPIRLPTADEWEMAARGSDGRRFPWGNAFDPEFESALSPWGGAQMVGVAPQWVSASDGSPQVCGGIKQWRCSVRIPADGTTTAAVRFVLET